MLIERLFGYPDPLIKAIGHPVMWMGALISALEKRLNKPAMTPARRKANGVLTLVVLLVTSLVPAIAISLALTRLSGGWIIEALLASPFLAQKELGRAVRSVAHALAHSLPAGRKAVAGIVGRDPEALDEAGVARAAIETLAENSSDGVIAPFFWLVLLGLPGIAVYKAINTADSMIGHLDGRYADFGWASARLDDLVNLLPARLTAMLFSAGAIMVKGANAGRAWGIALRDAGKHDSPNAGWPEAAMAGALDFALGGPRAYHGETLDLPKMGEGRTNLGSPDILKALDLYEAMLNVTLGLAFALVVLALR